MNASFHLTLMQDLTAQNEEQLSGAKVATANAAESSKTGKSAATASLAVATAVSKQVRRERAVGAGPSQQATQSMLRHWMAPVSAAGTCAKAPRLQRLQEDREAGNDEDCGSSSDGKQGAEQKPRGPVPKSSKVWEEDTTPTVPMHSAVVCSLPDWTPKPLHTQEVLEWDLTTSNLYLGVVYTCHLLVKVGMVEAVQGKKWGAGRFKHSCVSRQVRRTHDGRESVCEVQGWSR